MDIKKCEALKKRTQIILSATAVALFCGCLSACEEEIAPAEFVIQSSAFGEKEAMPKAYSCGAGISPPLSFSRIPETVEGLVVVLEDLDRISGTYTHWMIWGLPSKVVLPEDIESYPVKGAVFGTADDEKTVGYLKPCPPEGETHSVVFRAFGLDKVLKLEAGASRAQLNAALSGHIVAEARLTAKAVGE